MHLSDEDVLSLAPIALEHLPVGSALRARFVDARHQRIARALRVDDAHLTILRALEAVNLADRVRRSSNDGPTLVPLEATQHRSQLSDAGLISFHTSGVSISGWLVTELGLEFLRRHGVACAAPCGMPECGGSGGHCRRGPAT